MDLEELYELLMAGKKVTLPFPNEAEIANFRVQLFRVKKRLDAVYSATGFLDSPKVLSTSTSKVLNGSYELKVWMKETKNKIYTVILIAEDNDGSDDRDALDV